MSQYDEVKKSQTGRYKNLGPSLGLLVKGLLCVSEKSLDVSEALFPHMKNWNSH